MNNTASQLVRTFGGSSHAIDQGSQKLANLYQIPAQINTQEYEIALAYFATDRFITDAVASTLAVLLVEAAQLMDVSVSELFNTDSINSPGDPLINSIGLAIINRLREATSQLGFKFIDSTASTNTFISRSILP